MAATADGRTAATAADPGRAPRGADRAGPGADGPARANRRPGGAAAAEELVAAVDRLYGEGLERIFAALTEAGEAGRRAARAARRRRLVASLMLIHDLYPVALEDARGAGAGDGPPVHGVARRQRRAARDRGGRRPDPARGELQTAAPPRPRRSSWRSSRRSRRWRPTSRALEVEGAVEDAAGRPAPRRPSCRCCRSRRGRSRRRPADAGSRWRAPSEDRRGRAAGRQRSRA